MVWQRNSSSGVEEMATTRSRSLGATDPEKEARLREYNTEDEELENYSTYSSRSSSGSHQPMLSTAYSSRSNRPLIRLPNSIMRWLCLSIAFALLVFVFALVQLSWKADEHVKAAIASGRETKERHQWQEFPLLEKYYGGVRNLVPKIANIAEYPSAAVEPDIETANRGNMKRAVPESIEFDPYPHYSSSDYISAFGTKVDCFLDTAGEIAVPRIRVYEGIPSGFPDAVMGSNELLGMRDDVCYDRFGRLGPYGLGYSLRRGGSGAQLEGEREGADTVWQRVPEVDWRRVRFAEAQDRCVEANNHRFADLPESRIDRFRAMRVGSELSAREEAHTAFNSTSASMKLPRTAVLIRTWHNYEYTPEDLIYLRSIISELSLLSGGEYVVHFLVQVTDDNAAIWSDDETYDNILRDSLPEEFHGMGMLWTERQMGLMYGGLGETYVQHLPVHGVYRGSFMPVQFFAYQHPEYDFIWNWEMDIRGTGHWYHLLDSVSKWAKEQPRKGLWERNSRFYVPSEHGSFEDFKHLVRVQTEMGSSANNIWSGLNAAGFADIPSSKPGIGDKSIWGPEPPADDDVRMPDDPIPPTSYDKDKYTWGVGEDADLITFNPMFDPDGTTWLLSDDVTGYNLTRRLPPRRSAIITASRLSRKLLTAMHRETALNRHTMFSEMWPASCALHHGLKAVYAPHAVYVERAWPTKYLETTFNGGRNGASGGARTSVFGEREHNFQGTTWFYNAHFPENLWNRWLGRKFKGAGGEQVELDGHGRMCLPAMLLHPIKRVDLIVEGLRD